MTADNTVAALTHFQIKVNNFPDDVHRVNTYSNGRQQFQVTIIIKAVNAAGHEITVSQNDLKKVILMDYSSESNHNNILGRSYVHSGYDYLNHAVLETGITPSGNSTLTFWESVLPGVTSNLHIAAKITLNGVTYATNSHDSSVRPGGELKDGRSNSSFLVTPLRPEVLKADSFQVRKKLDNMRYWYPEGAPFQPPRWLELWEIRFKEGRRSIHGSSFPDTTPIPWFSQYTRDKKPYHCNWILPVRRNQIGSTVWLGWHRSGTEWRDLGIKPYDEDGVAYAVIESSDYISTHEYNNWGVSYIDNNGNSHHVLIHPNDNGRVLEVIDS